MAKSLKTLLSEKSVSFRIPDAFRFHLVLVGCGGTGSFLAQDLARLAYHLISKGKKVRLTFIDHDQVDVINLGRQNFCPADKGLYKAEVLARRYGTAFGLPIDFINVKFDPGLRSLYDDQEFTVLIGAVDNRAARLQIHMAMLRASGLHFWWVDAGNARLTGQVLCGNVVQKDGLQKKLGLAPQVPGPSLQAPSLIDPRKDKEEERETPPADCGEMAILEAQSLNVNRMAATIASQYLYDLCVKRSLQRMATRFDLYSGGFETKFITEKSLV